MTLRTTIRLSWFGLLAFAIAIVPVRASAHVINTEPSIIAEVYKKVATGIVLVNATHADPSPNSEASMHSVGSGILLDDKGLILTNNHVIDSATSIMVIME